MDRHWHLMRRIKSVSNPTNLLFFDTETKPTYDKDDPTKEYHRLWFGYAMAFRRDGRERTRQTDCVFHSTDTFWNFLLSRLDKERPLWIFAHNMPFDLTIVDAWLSADMYQISVDLPVLDDPPIIIACSHPKGKLTFVDTFNYWKSSVSDIGNNVGRSKLPMPTDPTFSGSWLTYCRNDVEIIALAVERLITWLEVNDLGSFKMTTPSIAMNVFKHKFMRDESILIHNDSRILKLERESYHGGLVMPYRIGHFTECLYKYDVNSLYPYMMQKQYPTKLHSQWDRLKPDKLRAYMDTLGAVSLVSIDTKKDAYPVVYGPRLIEAVGKFTVPLCGQELMDALDKGHVKQCHLTALYTMEPLFEKYVEYFYALRLKYKSAKDETGQLFCKLMLNSLYGKFGQQSHQWVDLTYNSLQALYAIESIEMPLCYESEESLPSWPIGVHTWRPLRYPHDLAIRQLPSSTQVKIASSEHRESSPIIASYVTSYGRAYMRALRLVAGTDHTYYTDTDSLIVDHRGHQRLQKSGFTDQVKIGYLKLEGMSAQTTIYGPKDYVFNEKPVIKGIRKDAKTISQGLYEQTQFEGLKSVLRRNPDPYITIKRVQKRLSREMNKGVVRKDGWVDYIKLDLM